MSAGTAAADSPTATAPDAAAHGRHTGLGLRTAVVTAVVTALVGAFINREHLDFLASKVRAKAPPAPELKLVSDPTSTISTKVPTTWGVVEGRFNVPFLGRQPAGRAVQVGAGPALRSEGINFTSPSAYIAASTEMAKAADIASRAGSELDGWLRTAAKNDDWSKEGCTYESEEWATATDVRLNVQIWKDCNGLAGTHLVTAFGASTERGLVVLVQVSCDASTDVDTARAVITSIAVREEKLPAGSSAAEPGASQVPKPSWLPDTLTDPATTGGVLLP